MYVPDSYWTSVLFATLSTYFSLVSSFCTLGQMFAADFFQIPPRDGHPCLSGYTIPTIRARWGLAPVRQCSCRAYKNHVLRKKNHVVRKIFYVASIFDGAAGRRKCPPWKKVPTAWEVSSTAGYVFPTASIFAFSKIRCVRAVSPWPSAGGGGNYSHAGCARCHGENMVG